MGWTPPYLTNRRLCGKMSIGINHLINEEKSVNNTRRVGVDLVQAA